jgi:four helix bundle protein
MFNFEKLTVWERAIDFARFEIATGSAFEVVSQAVISRRQGLLAEAEFVKLYGTAEELSRMLSGLRKS